MEMKRITHDDRVSDVRLSRNALEADVQQTLDDLERLGRERVAVVQCHLRI